MNLYIVEVVVNDSSLCVESPDNLLLKLSSCLFLTLVQSQDIKQVLKSAVRKLLDLSYYHKHEKVDQHMRVLSDNIVGLACKFFEFLESYFSMIFFLLLLILLLL